MSTIITIHDQGTKQLYAAGGGDAVTDIDTNFANLNADKYQSGASPSFADVTVSGKITKSNNVEKIYTYSSSTSWSTPLTITFNNGSAIPVLIKVTWAEGYNTVSGEVIFRIYGYSGDVPTISETIVHGTAIAGYVQCDVATTKVAKIQLNPTNAAGSITAKIEYIYAKRSDEATAPTFLWA